VAARLTAGETVKLRAGVAGRVKTVRLYVISEAYLGCSLNADEFYRFCKLQIKSCSFEQAKKNTVDFLLIAMLLQLNHLEVHM